MKKWKEGYGVGICTRGRPEILLRTLEAFLNQTRPPSCIIVIDNNDGEEGIDILESTDTTEIVVTKGQGKKSDATGSQQALQFLAMRNYKIGVKWDDDLIPNEYCIKELVDTVETLTCSAAGGIYPKTGEIKKTTVECKLGYKTKPNVPDGIPSHIQFFDYEGPCIDLFSPALYSSFAYSIPDALLVGGFYKGYSKHSFRHETDFTLRLAQVGYLRICTNAKAEHLLADGGIRQFNPLEAQAMRLSDEETFIRRMESFDISPTDWRKGVTCR